MARTRLLAAGIVALALITTSHGQTWMEEFEWNQLNPVGPLDWATAANWDAPAMPPGNADYPDDPDHMDADPDTLGYVVGANLSVALTADLEVRLNGGDMTIASLVFGVDNRTTTISGPGRLLFEHNEQNVIVPIPDPDPDAMPGDMVDEVTCAFNCGQSLVTSNGSTSGNNIIGAVVGSKESIDFIGTRTLTLSGGFEEITVDPLDTSVANRTNIRSHIGTYDPSMLVEQQTRMVITGTVTTAVDTELNPFGEEVDVPLTLGGGDSGIPEFQSAENSQLGQGYPHGILDLPGGITGAGELRIGTEDREGETLPLATVALYDNSHSAGTKFDRVNLILKHNNAFGTGSVRNGNPANQVGYNLIVEPGPGETAETVNRVLTNTFEVPHDITVKGEHSLTITGEYFMSNSAGWVNVLPAGELLTLTGRAFTEEDNIFTADGTGETRIQGQLRNTGLDLTDSGFLSTNNSGVIRKRGTGAVYVESSQFGQLNTFKSDFDNTDTIIVEGGNLHFATVADMGGHDSNGIQQLGRMGNIQSRGGAVGLDDGTVTGPGAATFMSKLSNFANRDIPFEGDVSGFGAWDNGGLMLASSDAGATLDFGAGGALENAQDMTVAAPETGLTFTGTIIPGNNTYRLGGGSGTLTVDGNNKLTGSRDLVVTNGGDFQSPVSAEFDRVRLGMVRLTGTHNYSGTTTIIGKYQETLQDQAVRDSIGVGNEIRTDSGPEELQYNGTTLAVNSLGDGTSSIGSSTSAAALMIQGSTLRYEGAGESTSRLFTVGTAGATIDASGSGAIAFTNSAAIAVDVAEPRLGSFDGIGFAGSDRVIYDLPQTDDVLVGMSISDSSGQIPAETTVTEIISPTRVRISNAMDQFALGTDETITFGTLDRTLTLTGTNTAANTFMPQVTDAADGGIVGLTKSEAGKWILGGANSYSGPTNVEAGTLIINGAHTGMGLATVSDGATLGGSGSIAGSLLADGAVAPGESAGVFSVGGDATFSGSSILQIELGGLTAGGQFDVLDVGGVLAVTDAELAVTLISGFQPVAGNTFDILDFASASGSFLNFNLPGNNADWDVSQLLVDGTLRFVGGSSVTGDFNGDGNYDCLDINALTAEIAANTNDAAFDMNGDGVVTLDDIQDAGVGWLAVGGAENPADTGGNAFLSGDANLDGVVDVSDFNIWNGNKFNAVAEWCSGDFNADGSVDVSDFNIWNSSKFQSSNGLNAVPEPSAFLLALLAFFVLPRRRQN